MTPEQAGQVYRAAYQLCQAVSEAAGRPLETLGDAHEWYYANYRNLQDAADELYKPLDVIATFLDDEELSLA